MAEARWPDARAADTLSGPPVPLGAAFSAAPRGAVDANVLSSSDKSGKVSMLHIPAKGKVVLCLFPVENLGGPLSF